MLLMSLMLASCGSLDQKKIKIGVTNWNENIAVANMWKPLLEEKGYKVELVYLEKAAIWTGTARGDLDINLEVWLPQTDKWLYKEYKNDIETHDTWYKGTGLGLVVPSYMKDVNTIEDLNKHKDELDNRIVGIEPGSSLMQLSDKAVKKYGLQLDLVQSSEAAMMSELKKAYQAKKPIAVTLWNPHWAFSDYDLKYLKDPKKVYGDKDDIMYITRKGFTKDHPELKKWLDNWDMTDEQLGTLMSEINKTKDPENGAKKWITENRGLVNSWFKQ
ncbi:glycine betaine ABC transporter substrate-binding protein [Ectobacillus panaciterrae]|uniref:glycine betaine ABC transporter substrate-binding protein n=1 Tax=Ectobacillus panaciterrae TaxID=363872 RepID=UPI003CCBCE37